MLAKGIESAGVDRAATVAARPMRAAVLRVLASTVTVHP
jgi:hypothetical protein